MKTPERPHDESQRLATLHSLNVLDSEAEERFDRVTRLAKRLFNVPIALVSLVDENRQWFKSCFGLDVRQTPRDISFCGHAILSNEPFVVEDASEDERFSDNPLVMGEPYIRFYAGVPLVYEDGSKLGTFCIIDREPHHLSDEEMVDLLDLAKMAERELAATHYATIDELTGISNRRGFYNLSEKALSYCQMGSFPYSIAYLDLDGFKAINDEYGHAAGDDALVAFTDIMRASFRDSDVFARIGGDEFVVFMSGASNQVAHIAINRFRESVDQYNNTSGNPYEIKFSEGIASARPQDKWTVEEMLEQADQLMYQCKKNSK